MNTTATAIPAKDLSKEAPRSARERLGGYAILARCLDKGRAEINETAGEFHFDCPLDNMLFEFKGVRGEDVRRLLEEGTSDQDVVKWLNAHGVTCTQDEVAAWSENMDAVRPFENKDQEKRDWFTGECERLGLNPRSTTLFDYLDADDRQIGA